MFLTRAARPKGKSRILALGPIATTGGIEFGPVVGKKKQQEGKSDQTG
jgi:hypothetical protein